jgi:hypothetical protein
LFCHFSISADFNYDLYEVTTRFEGQNPKEVSTAYYPLKSSGGISEGLQITVNSSAGFKKGLICRFPSFVVHSPFELPNGMDDLNFCQSDFAKSLDVLITPQVIVTDEDLIDVPPAKRGCFFDGERELKFYKVYTKLNCEVECYADFLHKAINCTPFFLARVESLRVCDLDDIRSIISAGSLNDTHKCNCLERCNSVNYEIEIFENSLIPSSRP